MSVLAKREEAALRYGFDDEQVRVIKATIAPGATDSELALFLMVCQKSGLDPFSRQIYLSERRSKDQATGAWTVKKSPETTIDGFRVIAERSGLYAGQLGPFWCGDDGKWMDVWLSPDKMPTAAKVGILRTDFKEPIWGVALFEEYKQTKSDGALNSMWQKMGVNQIAKCAESLGLRKAFPRDLSGFYSREEMGQAEVTAAKEAQQEVLQRKLAEGKAKQIEAPKEGVTLADVVENKAEFTDADIIEQRHTAEVADAEAVIEETERANPKPKRNKGDIGFKALGDIGDQKKVLRSLTGDDNAYYGVLKEAGVSHADELAHVTAKPVWLALARLAKKLETDKTTREEFQAEASRLAKKFGFEGPKRFTEHLSALGFDSLDAVIEEATGEQVSALLNALRAL